MRVVHELFIAGQLDASHLDSTPLRPVVADSWRRSLATGVDPDGGGAQAASVAAALDDMRAAHPLASALPIIRRLLIEDAADAGVVVAVTAADGTLLWVEGDRNAIRKAEAMNFVPGADWSERGAGTNAPGTALALDTELQIRGSEHFSRVVQPWSCTATPVHDPISGALIGAIDLTGGSDVASPQTLALIRATGVAIENHLALLHLRHAAVAEPTAGARLSVLGADRPQWQVTDADGHAHTTTLTGRHADILVLLSRHPEGLSADHLAMLLDDYDLDTVTVRAEMSRLRRVIGAEFVASRPYRSADFYPHRHGRRRRRARSRRRRYRGQPIRRRAASTIGVAGCRTAAHRAQREHPRSGHRCGRPAASPPLAGLSGRPRRPSRLADTARSDRAGFGDACAGQRPSGRPGFRPGLDPPFRLQRRATVLQRSETYLQ